MKMLHSIHRLAMCSLHNPIERVTVTCSSRNTMPNRLGGTTMSRPQWHETSGLRFVSTGMQQRPTHWPFGKSLHLALRCKRKTTSRRRRDC